MNTLTKADRRKIESFADAHSLSTDYATTEAGMDYVTLRSKWQPNAPYALLTIEPPTDVELPADAQFRAGNEYDRGSGKWSADTLDGLLQELRAA